MGEVIRFVPKPERERARLIRAVRARYDSILAPADPVSEQQDKVPVTHTVSGANAERLAACRCVIGKQDRNGA